MYDQSTLHPTPAGWLRRSGIPARYRGLGIEDCDTVRVEVDGKRVKVADSPVMDFLDGQRREGLMFDNARGLLLTGQPGRGKTRLLSVVLQELIRKMPPQYLGQTPAVALATPVGFIQVADLIEKRKRTFGLPEDSEERAKLDHTCEIFAATAGPEWDVRVAGLDDLGKEHSTSSRFAEDSIDHLLRRRFDKGLPTLISSNVPRDDWEAAYGESMVSFAHEALTELVIVNTKGDARR